MNIYESAENYLETILSLKERLGMVRSIDIANELGFSKPSVSVAMKKLRESGYIEVDADGYISLLPDGQAVAQRIYERQALLCRYRYLLARARELGLHTVLGVSNVSFGLPRRELITQSFLTQAMYAGLTLPILNPNQTEMMDAVALANVDDRRVISALALRGVNYALITVEGAGLDAPGVRDLLTSSMERLDADLVLSDHSISPAGKRLFAQVRGLPEPRGGKVAHAAHLAKEALYRVRTNGLSFALETARRRRRRIG